MLPLTRRSFLGTSAALAVAPAMARALPGPCPAPKAPNFRFGLVTYQWGRDWDLDTLLANCEATGVFGVELRTEHAHGVEPSLDAKQRAAVKARFAASPVTCLGYGSNEQFHEADPALVAQAIRNTKALVDLSRDIGGSGVKVKPNGFPRDVPRERTIEQIGAALRECGVYAAEQDQQIRVEVHGAGTQELPVMHAIMAACDHPAVKVCWNSNPQDLDGEGLAHNFELVRPWLGDTVHVRELDRGEYPYRELFDLLAHADYSGWICLEARTEPDNRVAALREQRQVFSNFLAGSRARLANGTTLDRR